MRDFLRRTHTDILGFKKQRHAQGRKNAFLPSWPCFYLIRCDCHMLMSDYSAWGRTPRWTRKQNALLGIFRHLGKMLLKQMHPESNLQHFPSQAWVSRGDDERLECFFMQHMDIWHLKKRWLPVIANLVWAPFGGSVFHFQYETWSNFFGHLWTHARKAVLSSDKHLSWAVSRWSASPQNVMAAAGRKHVGCCITANVTSCGFEGLLFDLGLRVCSCFEPFGVFSLTWTLPWKSMQNK